MERFNTITVAYVTGYSTSAITSWAFKNDKSAKDGFTVPEIIEFLHAPKKERVNGKIDEKAAARLKTALEVMGALNPDFKLES